MTTPTRDVNATRTGRCIALRSRQAGQTSCGCPGFVKDHDAVSGAICRCTHSQGAHATADAS